MVGKGATFTDGSAASSFVGDTLVVDLGGCNSDVGIILISQIVPRDWIAIGRRWSGKRPFTHKLPPLGSSV